MKSFDALKHYAELQDLMIIGFWEWNEAKDLVTCSDEINQLIGIECPQGAHTLSFILSLVHEGDRERLLQAIEHARKTHTAYDQCYRIRTTSGEVRWFHAKGRWLENDKGVMVGTLQDITTMGDGERDVLNATMFRELLDKSNDAIFIVVPEDGKIVDCNQRALAMLGYSRSELVGKMVKEIDISFKSDADWRLHVEHLESGGWSMGEGVHRCKDGREIPIEASVSLTKGPPPRVVAIVRDISERVANRIQAREYRAELERLVEERTAQLEAANAELARYVQVVDNNILTSSTDLKGIITYVSDAFCKATGYSKDELIGHNHNIVRHPDISSDYFRRMWDAISHGKIWTGEVKNLNKDGSELWIDMIIEPIRDDDGTIIGYTAVRHDISDKKRIEELIITDPLTGVYNRRHFYDVMEKELRRMTRHHQRLCFAMVDVDHFKRYNDTYGHQKGDMALRAIAQTMKKFLRRVDDYIFRLGGEEFGLICYWKSEEEVRMFAEEMREKILNLDIEHRENTAADVISISMGIVMLEGEKTHSLTEVYDLADHALYQAKGAGRNSVVVVTAP